METKALLQQITRIADALDVKKHGSLADELVHALSQLRDDVAKAAPTVAVLDLGVVRICDALGGVQASIDELKPE